MLVIHNIELLIKSLILCKTVHVYRCQMNEPTDSIEDRQESALQVLTYKQVTVQMLTTIDQT